ncbi:MAG: TonB-dependent receptor, partial [Chitinophagaceae bacterium]|nr:TonB-dependent receptor [Chitinophagaceae bacterium]
KTYDIRKDYSDYLYQKAITQQYMLNLSGGSNKSSYYLSGNYDKSRANVQENSSERITLNSQFLFNPIKNLDVTVRYNYSLTKNKFNGINSIAASGKYSNIYPYAQLADDQGNYLATPTLFSTSFINDPGVAGLQDWSYIPLQDRLLNNSTSRSVSNRMYGALKYHFTKVFNTEISYQYQESNATSTTIYDRSSYYTRNLINQYSVIADEKVIDYNIPVGDIQYNGLSTIAAHSGRAQLNYNEIFGHHEFSAIGGIEIRETKLEGSSSTVYGYDAEVGSSVSVDYKTLFTLFPSFSALQIPGAPIITPYSLDRYRSYYANASYTYAGRYTITGSARVDQSNLFGVKTNQKGVPLWSVGARWQIDKEDFYHVSWLPIFRSRITYGYNGNIDKGVTAITTAAFYNNNLNNRPFAQIQTPGNPELRWEKIGMLNIAVDFAFKKQLLSGSIEYYTKRGKDLFGDALLASSSGFLQARGNFADMSGSGLDVNLNSVAINKGSFSWAIDALFSYVRDEVTRNEGTNKQIGKPVNSVYS